MAVNYLYAVGFIVQLQIGFSSNSLQLVHVVFRHGHRTPLENISFHDDPNSNESFFPIGFGSLTNEGKMACFNLGEFLRKRYGSFLGDIYVPELIDAVSSGVPRTSMSLMLVLAGLFPPKNTPLEWNKHLNWQPIIFKELSPDDKLLLSPFNNNCSTYHNLLKEYLRSEDGRTVLKSYEKLYQYVQEKTHAHLSPVQILMAVFDAFLTRTELNLDLPLWSKDIFFHRDGNPVVDLFLSSSAGAKLKQLTGGFLLKKILRDTQLRLKQKLEPSNPKIFIYSAHDNTVFYLLNALEVLIPHAPHYTACIMVEVHTINNVNSIRILYRDLADLKVLTIPGCTEFCTIADFIKLVGKNIPSDAFCKSNPKCC